MQPNPPSINPLFDRGTLAQNRATAYHVNHTSGPLPRAQPVTQAEYSQQHEHNHGTQQELGPEFLNEAAMFERIDNICH